MTEKSSPARKPEALPLNESPLNQLAKSALAKLKEDADPSYLYSLQLAQWMLIYRAEGLPHPMKPYAWEVAQQIATMSHQRLEPELLQDYLLNRNRKQQSMEDAANSLAESAQEAEPEELAAELSLNLWENLQKRVSSLRPPTDQWE